MIISKDGIRPDPAKVEALDFLEAPKDKNQLISFLCMMQSNAEFIPNFSQRTAKLRKLIKKKAHFKWNVGHEKAFRSILQAFKKEALLRYFDMNKPIFIFVDAHITGLGAVLAQGPSIEKAKPVAFASRGTNKAESNYPQLDLEAMSLDFSMRRFRNYIVGAPHQVTLITDHKPLVPVFNGKRHGSIRTERIKMRHQDIQFVVEYRKGKLNPTDYISRHSISWEKLPIDQKNEADDLTKLLYFLHMTPVIDNIGIHTIAKHTSSDKVLSDLREIVCEGRKWIHRNADPALKRFTPILPEITVAQNGILLKGERMVLPRSLQQTAITLAHKGSHPGQTSIQRRLRNHFFFHSMNEMVQNFVSTCKSSEKFTDKKVMEPIVPHKVPEDGWSQVSVDLFGPMSSNNHVVVVQDLATRYPAAKIVRSTAANSVLPALSEIYNNLGNPDKQLSDNGPPFNSQDMLAFATKRRIKLQKITPGHPSANPVETFMRPLGKAMKIAKHEHASEKEALESLLENYRNTPHPATNVSPGSMLFRNPPKSCFPRFPVDEATVRKAKKRDVEMKKLRESRVNASKYRQRSSFCVGDHVILRNFKKQKKFDPMFLQTGVIQEVGDDGRRLIVKSGDTIFHRHPDDVKLLIIDKQDTIPDSNLTNPAIPNEPCTHYADDNEEDDTHFTQSVTQGPNTQAGDVEQHEEHVMDEPVQQQPNPEAQDYQNAPRRSTRVHNKPSRYGVATEEQVEEALYEP